MQTQLLIAAAGKGMRLHPEYPKQFLTIAGKPLLMHCIQAFREYDANIRIVVVVPDEYMPLWNRIREEHAPDADIRTITGGPARFHSVKNGLKLIDDNGLVAIHDGVRPLVSGKLIARVSDMAKRFGNAVPAAVSTDSVRITENALSNPLPKDKVRLIQTPQCFHAPLIKKAYQVSYDESFTDDACVLEAQGERIYLVEGERENIKVTSQSDLVMAEALLNTWTGR